MTERITYETTPRPREDLLRQERDEHVWVAMAVFRISPEALRESGGMAHLDRENLANIEVGCMVCEQAYADRLTYRKCPGEPPA